MARRADPRQVAKLVTVQRVRRATAEAAMIVARRGEAEAASEREAAREVRQEAQNDWFACLDSASFDPDRARGLAGRLLTREAAADSADERLRIAASLHDRCQGDWRQCEALTTRSEANLRTARRADARHRDELKLDALADRVTFAWFTR